MDRADDPGPDRTRQRRARHRRRPRRGSDRHLGGYRDAHRDGAEPEDARPGLPRPEPGRGTAGRLSQRAADRRAQSGCDLPPEGAASARSYIGTSKVASWASHANPSMATSNSNVLAGLEAYITADLADG